jgi:hypothetical protein
MYVIEQSVSERRGMMDMGVYPPLDEHLNQPRPGYGNPVPGLFCRRCGLPTIHDDAHGGH